MIRYLSLFIFVVVASLLMSVPALAAPTKTLGKFGYWSAYQLAEGNAAVCYMSLSAKPPVKKGEKKVKRGDVILMVTHRPSEGATDVVSYSVGAKFKPASDVKVQIGDKSFTMFTQDDAAWSYDAATDHAIANAVRGGASVTFTGQLASGAALADTVSLKGSADAYYAIGKACGLQVSKPKAASAATPKTTAKTPPQTTKKTVKPTTTTPKKTP
ncbi:MAG TPA: hypothetical protein DCY07_07050 [Rhodospirillaceae bacterium]|nr:hypothetical protein [Rhodospirillaceae bacterium]